MKHKFAKHRVLVLFFSFMLSWQLQAQCSLSRTTPPIGQFDYTYWSAPVSGFTILGVSPATLADKFFKFDPGIGNWVNVDPATTTMEVGKGYIIRGPQGASFTPYTANFTGTPNSGPINTPIVVGASTFNLIGNPYCEALMADCFIRDLSNQGTIGGTLYFWTHNIPIDWSSNTTNPTFSQVDGIYNYNTNSYAAYNLLGGVGAGYALNPDQTISVDRPRGNVASCQSFFVRGISNGSAHFDDYMINTVGNTNDQFFKTDTISAVPPPGSCDVDRHRLWLQIRSSIYFKETLVGYSADGATTGPGLDRNFDGIQIPPSAAPGVNLYSLSPGSTEKLAIQGRATPITTGDVVTLGYTCPAGTVRISADADGLLSGANVWLKETFNSTVSYYNIKSQPYIFNSPTSVTDDITRFQVVFTAPSLPNLNPTSCGLETSVWNQLSIQNGNGLQFMVRATNVNTGAQVEFLSNNATLFTMNHPGIAYDTDYRIQIGIQIGGVWTFGPYSTCVVRTPIPTTSLTTGVNGSCGSTVTSNWTTLYAFNTAVDLGLAATGYRFEVRIAGTLVGIVESTVSRFCLKNLAAAYTPSAPSNMLTPFQPTPSTVYTIRVQLRIGGTWQVDSALNPIYGPSCTVTSTAAATQKLDDIKPLVNVYPNPSAENFRLDITSDSNETVEAIVYDMAGRQIETFKLNASEVNSKEIGGIYPSGVYTIVVKQGDLSQTLKVIKK